MLLDFIINLADYFHSIVMPKSQQKPATQPGPTKPALSSAAKAAQCERVMEYKNAKASTIASSVKGKGVRYYDDDDVDNNENNDDDKGEDGEEGEGGSGDEGMEEVEEMESKCKSLTSSASIGL
jgi:hypothetical protein